MEGRKLVQNVPITQKMQDTKGMHSVRLQIKCISLSLSSRQHSLLHTSFTIGHINWRGALEVDAVLCSRVTVCAQNDPILGNSSFCTRCGEHMWTHSSKHSKSKPRSFIPPHLSSLVSTVQGKKLARKLHWLLFFLLFCFYEFRCKNIPYMVAHRSRFPLLLLFFFFKIEEMHINLEY